MAEFSAQRNITQNIVKRITKNSRHDSFYGSTWLLGQQRVILIVLMEYQSLFSIIYISLFSILTGSHHPCSHYVFTNEDIKNNFYFSTSCTFRILFHQIITLVSRTLRIFFHLIVTLISRALRILLHSKVTSVSRAFQDWLTFDFYVSVLRSFRILFHWIVASVSRSQLGFSFILSSLEYLAHF